MAWIRTTICANPWLFSVSALLDPFQALFLNPLHLVFIYPFFLFSSIAPKHIYSDTHTLHSPPLLSSSHFRLYHSTNDPLLLPLSFVPCLLSLSLSSRSLSHTPSSPLLLSLRHFKLHSQRPTVSQRPFFRTVPPITHPTFSFVFFRFSH
ncbi:hypothetical protein K457DRAFT_838298 [Linnemannia elongata AG-77]|uniref:Uncharacterized protein n=1 Tax=Linnemannia elongata AG-77 TaxID=1314771 RepID=A0A197JGY2_9FUNG|nr:hypothetical protein K457DRAFT_838298 [Linnemannia elongata AG-77]